MAFWELVQNVQEALQANCAQKREVCAQIEELLYKRWNITAEQIEAQYYPFGQSGYLSVRQKFEIMLYLAAREAHGNGRKQLFAWAGWLKEDKREIREKDVEEAYLSFWEEERIQLTKEDKRALFTGMVYEAFGYGILEGLLGQETEGVLIGELFWRAYDWEGAALCAKEGIGVLEQGRAVRLEFLRFANKEELCRVIKRFVCMGGRGELTAAEPEWQIRFADGTAGYAVRPPKAEEWGVEIIREKGGGIWKPQ